MLSTPTGDIEYTTDENFGQQFNVLFGKTNIDDLPECRGNYDDLHRYLNKYKTTIGGIRSIWTDMYLGNYINEKLVIGPIDQVNAPLLPEKALKLITEIFNVSINPIISEADANHIIEGAGHKLLLVKKEKFGRYQTPAAGLQPAEGIQRTAQGIRQRAAQGIRRTAQGIQRGSLDALRYARLLAVGSGLHESDDILYKGNHKPGEFLNLITDKNTFKSKKILIVTHGAFIKALLTKLNRLLGNGQDDVKFIKPKNFDCIKLYYGDGGGICKIEHYSSSTWANEDKATLYNSGEECECFLIMMRHCPACHNTTTKRQALKKTGLSGIVSNCLPLSIEFLFGKLPMEQETPEFSTWWVNTFNELKKENIKALNKTASKIKLKRIEVEEKGLIIDTDEYKTLDKLSYYWNSITFQDWKDKIQVYANNRVEKLYTDVFEEAPEKWIPIMSCSFRTCLTATMVSLALSLYKSKIPGISTPLALSPSSPISTGSSDPSSPDDEPSSPSRLTTPIQESPNNN